MYPRLDQNHVRSLVDRLILQIAPGASTLLRLIVRGHRETNITEQTRDKEQKRQRERRPHPLSSKQSADTVKVHCGEPVRWGKTRAALAAQAELSRPSKSGAPSAAPGATAQAARKNTRERKRGRKNNTTEQDENKCENQSDPARFPLLRTNQWVA